MTTFLFFFSVAFFLKRFDSSRLSDYFLLTTEHSLSRDGYLSAACACDFRGSARSGDTYLGGAYLGGAYLGAEFWTSYSC